MGGVSTSVAVCTYNRCDYLHSALLSVRDQLGDAHEAIVIDNGSSDRTREVVETLMAEMPSLRYVEEPRLGLSHARNRAIEVAQGDLIAFLDDDAVADPTWLAATLDAFAAHPDAAAIGGRVDLIWPDGRRPAWLPDGFERSYAGTDFGVEPRRLIFPETPVGANMAFRRSVLRDLGGFNVHLGRKGRQLISGEEQELFQRIAGKDLEVWYDPEAGVGHHVIPDRVNRRWVLRRCFYQGWSMAITVNDPGAGGLDLPPAVRGRASFGRRVTALSPVELAAKIATRAGFRLGRLTGAGGRRIGD